MRINIKTDEIRHCFEPFYPLKNNKISIQNININLPLLNYF